MRVVFAGSPPFATPIFKALLASNHEVAALVTPPEKPRGRGMRVEPSPLASAFSDGNILFTSNANDSEVVGRIREAAPEVLAVASFGQLLRDELLSLARHGALNVHASLLPRHRGASPVAQAILDGDAETGVSIQRMVRKLDAGPVGLVARLAISPRETAGELSERLSRLGGELLVSQLDLLAAGTAQFIAQDETLATYARKLTKESRRVRWDAPAGAIERHVRAMTPWPGATSRLLAGGASPGASIAVKLLKVEAKENVAHSYQPGSIVNLPTHPTGKPPDSLDVATVRGVVTIHRLQSEGGRPLAAEEFLRGRRLAAGSRFAGDET